MAVLRNISDTHMQITLSASVEENDTIVVGWLIISRWNQLIEGIFDYTWNSNVSENRDFVKEHH